MTTLDGTNISHYSINLTKTIDGLRYELVRQTDTDGTDIHFVGAYFKQRDAEMAREGMIKAFESIKN